MREARRGYLDPDVAAGVGQLAGGPAGRLRANGREILASTTQLVGATWGESHRNVLIAQTMIYLEDGDDGGRAGASISEIARMIYGRGAGGAAYAKIARAAYDLYCGELTIEGFDTVTGQAAPGRYSRTRLLIDLTWPKVLDRTFKSGGISLTRREIGQEVGGMNGTDPIRWRFHPEYADRIHTAEVVSLDWDRLRALRGVAQGLWIQLSAPRFQFCPVLENPQLERLELPLDEPAYQALGVHAREDRFRRRTLNDAGQRIMEVDPSYDAFEAHGGKGMASHLFVVRRAGVASAGAEAGGQLSLPAAAA